MELNDTLKELVKQLLTDNLEIEITQESEDRSKRLWVRLKLFGETISSDFLYV